MSNFLYIHDHKITIYEGRLFSRGGLTPTMIKTYKESFGEISICSRLTSLDPEKLTLLSDQSITHYNFPDILGDKLLRIDLALSAVKEAVKDKDYIIARLPSISGLLACWVCRNSKKKLIIELVGCPFDSYWGFGNIKGRLLAIFMFLFTKFYISNCQNIHYVTKGFLQNRYPTKATNILESSDVEIILDQRNLSNRINRLSASELTEINLGMIGNYESKYKGYETAFRALELVRNKSSVIFQIYIVGGGDKKKLLELANKYNVLDLIHFEGVKDHPHGIYEWLYEVDIFLQPSEAEGLPRSLIEAMSSGCACIGSNVGGIPELLDSNNLIEPKDYLGLSMRIISLSKRSTLIMNSNKNFHKAKEFDYHQLKKKKIRIL